MTDDQRDQKMNDLKNKVDKIYVALLGSELAKDGGLIQRVLDAEAEILILKRDDATQKLNDTKTALYVKIIWGMGGMIVTSLIAYVLNHLSK